MRSFLDYLFTEAPWSRPVLAWTLAGLVIILILMLPAYFIFLPVFRRIHAELSRFLKELVQRHTNARAERRTRLEKEAEEHQKNAHLKRITIGAYRLWRKTVSGTLRELKEWKKQLVKAEETLRDVAGRLPGVQGGLLSLKGTWPKELPALPSPEALPAQTASLRVVRLTLIIGSIILLCIIFVNTGMLGQIIRDLGFIPSNLRFATIPVYWIFALILTLVEASWGFIHGATSARHSADGDADKVRVWPIVAVLMALGLGCLEGYFYSRIAPGKEETFTFPLINYSFPQSDFFFFWGFSLVMALFGLGKIFYDSFAAVRRGTPLTEIHRQVREMVKLASRSKDVATKVEGTIKETGAQITVIDGTLIKLLEGSGSTIESGTRKAIGGVERLKADIIELSGNAPVWAGISKGELTKSEVVQLIHSAGLWLCLTLIAGVVMILTGWEVVRPTRLGWVLAIILTIAFVGVGFLLGAGEVIVQDAEPPKLITANPAWSMSMATALGVLLVAAYIVGLFKLAIPHGQGLLWVCNFLNGAFLVAAGHQLSPLLAVAVLWLQHVAHWLVTIAEFVYEILARVFFGLAVVIEYVFLILASPIEMIFRRGRTDSHDSWQN